MAFLSPPRFFALALHGLRMWRKPRSWAEEEEPRNWQITEIYCSFLSQEFTQASSDSDVGFSQTSCPFFHASLCIYGQWLVSKGGVFHLSSPSQLCTQEEHTVDLRTISGRWGTECSVPVRLAPVMAHLGSYEEILAHVFHTSVLSSITLPGEFFINIKHTPQESS